MFSALKNSIYVQISPERLTVKNVRTGQTLSEVPEVAITQGPKPKILGVGAQARPAAAGQAAEVVNPFAHPRTLVSDFTLAEQLIKAFVQRLQGKSLLVLAPVLVIHPLGSPSGGFTQVENRAFREMGFGSGASTVTVWNGRVLTDHEVLSGKLPAGEGVSA